MPTYRAQVVIPMFSLLPSDVTTNTFHFTEMTPLGIEAVADAVTPLIEAFYESIYTVARPMAGYLVPSLTQVNWYNLDDPPPRAPEIRNMPLTVTTAHTTVPTEVSCVVSFQGNPISGTPQARRRGRIFLPGITDAWLSASSAASYPIIATADAVAIGDAAEVLMNASVAASAFWSVWSTTDSSAVRVTNGWVDNGPDTQRRRSVEASLRNVWP